ncbi:methionyl-tRNA formyltransferase [Cardiobacteriaceae bacterium TAE3-ERU3]|nr:methionyl-tRNA formyltransferase [Cardiobacteriaceae bacterium TAE3-ERU3]
MSNKTADIWFAGTPEFAAHSLLELIRHPDYHVSGVLTQPDRPAGRGRKLKASAVKEAALAHDIPVAQPEKLRQEEMPFADRPRPDVIIVAAYGLLLPQWFLDYPRLGCINIHASLLPRWRGAAPIQRAIEAGDDESGICIMQMDAGLDTGAVWLEKRLTIKAEDDATTLHNQLMELGGEALIEALPTILAQQSQPIPQDNDQATYAHKLNKAEAAVNWQESAELISRKIRAFSAFPVAHAQLDGKSVRFYRGEALNQPHHAPPGTVIKHDKDGLDIATSDGVIRIISLQMPGKQITSAADLRNGRDLTGQLFS